LTTPKRFPSSSMSVILFLAKTYQN